MGAFHSRPLGINPGQAKQHPELTLMASSFRLQPLTTVDTDRSQELDMVADVTAYRSLVIQVRKPALSTGGNLIFETSATLEETSFVPLPGGTLSLSTNENERAVLEHPLRYLRWRVDGHSGGPARFLIDVVGRES